ncbi:MAG TPA: Rieske (2Fe-2S) protein [Thermoanaerobaculia bacterium]|nr:Rieske (2Fe-2S) protein [Thermoanaerobaculia bacterium]
MVPETESRSSLSRRRLVNRLMGGSFGALVAWILYPVLRFLEPVEVAEAATSQIEAGLTNDPELLAKGFKIVPFGNDPVIVVRAGEGDYRALSATCTHLDCIVEYRPDRGLIWCNCHNGQFDLSGQVVGGPPPRPLRPYRVHLVEGVPGGADTLVVEKV